MKFRAQIKAIALLAFLLMSLAGCDSPDPPSPPNPLIGSWETDVGPIHEIMELKQDGTYTVNGSGPSVTMYIEGIWSNDSSAQTITLQVTKYIFNGSDLGGGPPETCPYTLSADQNTLTITNPLPQQIVYSRI